MSKLTFTAYGNCQAGALAQVLLDYPEFECRYTYRPVPPVHLLTPSSAGAVLETVHSSDFLLYQHMFNVTGGPELTTPKILAALPTQAERIHLSGALIFQGYTPHLVVLPKLPALLGNEHDCGIVQGFLSGLDADTIVKVIQDPDFYDRDFSLEWLNSALDTIDKRECLVEADIRIAPFMRSHWRSQRLYDGTAHPRRAVLEYLAEQVLARLGLDPSAKKMEHGPELLGMPSAPLYPSTYRTLDLAFQEDLDRCLTSKGEMPLGQFVHEMLSVYATHDRSMLQTLLKYQRPFIAERFQAVLNTGKHAGVTLPDAPWRSGLGADLSPLPDTGRGGGQRWATAPAGSGAGPGAAGLQFSRQETDLYVATMGEDRETVAAAWQRWRAATVLDTLPHEQYLLLPRLYTNLAHHGLAGEADPRIKGVYWRTWYQNQQVVRSVWSLLASLQTAALPAGLLGDAIAAYSCYHSLGERPITQIDVMIYSSSISAVHEILGDAGWRLERPDGLLANTRYQYWISQVTYRRAGLPALVLRWRVYADAPVAEFEQRLLDLAFALPATRYEEGMISYEAQLALAGAAAAVEQPTRLLAAADVSQILRQHQDVSWEQVYELAHLLQVARPLRSSLLAVSTLLDLPLPGEALAELADIARYEPEPLRRGGAGLAALPGRARYHLERWRRITRARGSRPSWSGLLRYLQYTAGAAEPWQLPFRFAGAAIGRPARRLAPLDWPGRPAQR